MKVLKLLKRKIEYLTNILKTAPTDESPIFFVLVAA
jgi:hypothetical protein